MKTDSELEQSGYTDSGRSRYKSAVTGYCDELFAKSLALGDRDKAVDTPREVTHEHVRSAAGAIAIRGRESKTAIQVWCQIGEYVCAALAGVGGGKLETSWGTVVFGLSLAFGVILFVIRNTKGGTK
jgi:hypothetical protein